MASHLSGVYTHKNHGGFGIEDKKYPKPRSYGMITRQPEYADVMSAYVADFPQVRAAVNRVATGLALVAASQLAAHPSRQARSSHPRIEVTEGDRSDMYVLLVVGPEGQTPKPGEAKTKAQQRALAAAYSIEYGRLGYTDSRGRRQRAAQGVSPLHVALAAVGWGF